MLLHLEKWKIFFFLLKKKNWTQRIFDLWKLWAIEDIICKNYQITSLKNSFIAVPLLNPDFTMNLLYSLLRLLGMIFIRYFKYFGEKLEVAQSLQHSDGLGFLQINAATSLVQER